MEVLTSTTAGRPRFIPTEPVVMSSPTTVAATFTMTRSPIFHNHQQQVCHNNGQGSPPSSADTSIRDKTRLLQLAEKVHTRKSASPNYTKSFRAITSAVSKSGSNKDEGRVSSQTSTSTPTVRRTNSTMFSSASPNAPVSRSKVENYKNPKLYASFSSKSCSKLTKALIRSDPAKTNIEHLVNYNKKVCASSPSKNGETNHNGISNGANHGTVNGKRFAENGDHNHHQAHNNNGSISGGLSSFITPLKALHASFHERSSKLGQTRSKLFSNHHNKEVSASNAKLLFGTTENLHSSCSSSGSSSEDILSADIIDSKTSHRKPSSQQSEHKQKRNISGGNNNKYVRPTPLSSTVNIKGQLVQNGSNVRGTTAATTLSTRPDFLEGFQNDKPCRTRNITTNEPKISDHVADERATNGVDRLSDRIEHVHEQEISSANNTNSLITPDILGGCIDAPTRTGLPTLAVPSENGSLNTQKGICENYQNGLSIGGSRQASEINCNTVGRNGSSICNKATVQQQHSSNKDTLQKRKNIVVRMSCPNDDEADYSDLYGICNNDVNGNAKENGVEHGGNIHGDIWPISPITVSTVTPKNMQFAAPGANALSDNTTQLIIAATTTNYNGMSIPSPNDKHIERGTPLENNQQSASSLHLNNRPIQNYIKAEEGVSHRRNLNNRPTSSLSTITNSCGLINSVDVHKKPQQCTSDKRGQQLVARSSSLQQPQEKAELPHPYLRNHNKIFETPQSHSPEATGSSTWLKTKNPSAPGGANDLNRDVYENVVNGNASSVGMNSVEFKKQALKKSASPKSGGGCGSKENDRLASCSGAPHLLNDRVVASKCNETDDNSINDNAETKDCLRMKPDEDSQEEMGRSRRGMFMEAETSFSPHQKISRSGGGGRGRPQTALLSDEYARYLGYDYDNGKEEVQQQAHLHVLHLGNKNSVSSATCEETCESVSGDGDAFGAEEERKMMMLAITTTATRGEGKFRDNVNGKSNVISIMKGKRQETKPIMHSVSFRGSVGSTDHDRGNTTKCLNEIAEHPTLGNCESLAKFDRKRSRSLPKSFMSMRNGLRNVLPSQWVRDGLAFERLSDCENPCPARKKFPEEDTCPTIDEHRVESSEAIKMRWSKLGSTSSSFSDRRPKSFDYAQRKAWMKLYRDMEVSQASGSSSPAPRISRPISKGSITHLHLQEASSTDRVGCSSHSDEADEACRCEYESDGASMSNIMRSSADVSETSPSLFKRFSKTFSLRFGSGSNVSKQAGDAHRKAKSKGAIGSSPDLFNRMDVDGSRDKVNGKMRKTNVKSVRGDKCQSGDSGIGMDEQQTEARQISNLRRIRSDYISSSTIGVSPVASSYASRQHANTSALAKLSLVEIPDHSWDEHNGSPNEGSGASNTASYEDLVDAKLDRDDGFSSSDEGHRTDQPQNPTYYHSLPHRKHNKKRLKETESTNSCGGEVPHEDNSIRGKVVREIIHTEQNYVKTLNDIVQGFLNPCRARNDLFSSRTVQNIFSNIEEILRLHVKFLEALKSKVDPTYVSNSNVGGVFTSWADSFSLYSEYCCNNPISVATVRSLVQFPQYAEFFEACRRLQMMDKLPLHGFLLRPIQRICQYHLQLNELLKHTEESHSDHQSVVVALETMKSVATKINDTQRQFESLQEIIRFQNSIDGWEGPSLVDRNTVILRKGELVKVTHGRKHKEVYVAVLNKDLIYCKKDFMKKSGYVFDGRIDLNLRMWINIDSNEEDEFFGMVHNSWRMYSPERRTWILFTASSPSEKRKWISALEKSKEDIVLDHKLREMAVVTTALADSEMMYGGASQGHNSNTLPKSSKKSKAKQLTVTKVDSDAMLIEVGKLKRSTMYTNANPSAKEGMSRFYV